MSKAQTKEKTPSALIEMPTIELSNGQSITIKRLGFKVIKSVLALVNEVNFQRVLQSKQSLMDADNVKITETINSLMMTAIFGVKPTQDAFMDVLSIVTGLSIEELDNEEVVAGADILLLIEAIGNHPDIQSMVENVGKLTKTSLWEELARPQKTEEEEEKEEATKKS